MSDGQDNNGNGYSGGCGLCCTNWSESKTPLGLIPGKLWCDAKGWKELDITLFSIQLY